jgi:hypothetical protein
MLHLIKKWGMALLHGHGGLWEVTFWPTMPIEHLINPLTIGLITAIT